MQSLLTYHGLGVVAAADSAKEWNEGPKVTS